MNIDDLKTEIETDPLTRGYSGMTDQEVADSLNTANRTRMKSTISGADVAARIDATEWGALTDAQQEKVLALCAIDTLDPANGGLAHTVLTGIFPGGGNTIQSLANFRDESISRAVELGLGEVKAGHVEEARRQA